MLAGIQLSMNSMATAGIATRAQTAAGARKKIITVRSSLILPQMVLLDAISVGVSLRAKRAAARTKKTAPRMKVGRLTACRISGLACKYLSKIPAIELTPENARA